MGITGSDSGTAKESFELVKDGDVYRLRHGDVQATLLLTERLL
jgi:hypothetical protein